MKTNKKYIIYVVLIAMFMIFASVMVSKINNSKKENVYQMKAYLHSVSENGNSILKDEYGNLWEISDYNLSVNDILLLEVSDSATKKDNRDDRILAIWRYAYTSSEEPELSN